LVRKLLGKNVEVLSDANDDAGRVTLEKPGLGLTKQNCLSCSADVGNCETQFTKELPVDGGEDNSLALVPYQSLEADTNSSSVVIQESPELKSGWSILRWAFQAKRPYVEKSLKRTSVFQWVLRLPNWQSSAVVYPDQKKSNCDQEDDNCSSLDEDSSAIVPFGSATVCPLSPCSGLGNLLPKELLGLREKYSSSCMYFSYQELLLATSNFMPGSFAFLNFMDLVSSLPQIWGFSLIKFDLCFSENMVGKGGSSHVYKGCLPDGKELAVKILKPSQDVLKEFVQEIEIITTLHHKNIISLVGFCFEDNNLILVYDFLSRVSLDENLHYPIGIGEKKKLKMFHFCSILF